LSSEFRKPEPKLASKRCSPTIDPVNLRMVSDYLKRTISERPYAFILESLVERLEMDKIDRRMSAVGIIPVPYNFDIRKLSEEKTIAFLPYCSKPFDCPSNAEFGRKSNKCQMIDGQCNHQSCSMDRFIKAAKKLGAKEFHVIDTDSGLFEWLTKKKKEGFTHVIGAACEFAVCYALEVIHGQLGFDGLIITITGDKCKTKKEYAESESADRDRLTFVDEWTIIALERLAEQIGK